MENSRPYQYGCLSSLCARDSFTSGRLFDNDTHGQYMFPCDNQIYNGIRCPTKFNMEDIKLLFIQTLQHKSRHGDDFVVNGYT